MTNYEWRNAFGDIYFNSTTNGRRYSTL